jgi:segregation and condensation protein B
MENGAGIGSHGIDELDNEKERESLRKLEAALFVSGRFLRLKELVSLTDINPILLRRLLEDLSDKYKGSGIEIVKKENMWKMDVSSDFGFMVNRLATGSSEFTKAEQETLAIVAYKQPIKQSVLIKIRGNKAYDHVKNFVSLGLVNKKRVGHTSELTLKDEFYDYFSLEKKGLFEDRKVPKNQNELSGLEKKEGLNSG